MALRSPNWTRILTILLVILATIALLYITFSILERFTQAILLFVLGAIAAYILTPLVKSLEHAFRIHWLAVVLAYLMVAVGIFALSISLFTPFVQQTQSLIDNLHNPSPSSLSRLTVLVDDANTVHKDVDSQVNSASSQIGQARVPLADVKRTGRDIATLQRQLTLVGQANVTGPHVAQGNETQKGRLPANPQAFTAVPPSYVQQVAGPVQQVASLYTQATAAGLSSGQSKVQVTTSTLLKANDASSQAVAASESLRHTVSTTPVLLLKAQLWLDTHNIHVDLHSKFGEAAQQLSNQGTGILDNAITIASETATILLDITLMLIISFYLVNDGPHMIRRGIQLVPIEFRDQASFFVSSLDRVLGGYIRGQIALALVAGALAGGGAAVLDVPYPLLIAITTALLELVPVIGPLVTAIPAVLIALFFTSVPTTIILLVWFLVFQQVVTNVVGPRIMGIAVGIHPLEALLAVLVGYPLGGLLGAFLAVPVAGIVHLLVREAYAYFVLGHASPVIGPADPLPPRPVAVKGGGGE